MSLAESVYRATRAFPSEELYGLVSQMRRAAVSIPSNVAEGQGRKTRGEFVQFLGQARGSLAELGTQVALARRLALLRSNEGQNLEQRIATVGRLLNALLSRLSKN
jgi:four helix bundle protein